MVHEEGNNGREERVGDVQKDIRKKVNGKGWLTPSRSWTTTRHGACKVKWKVPRMRIRQREGRERVKARGKERR